jgi:hypothetical protein
MDHERSGRSGAEKVWNERNASADLSFKGFLGWLLRIRSAWERGGYRHRISLVGPVCKMMQLTT